MQYISDHVASLSSITVVRELESIVTRPTVAVIAAVPDTRTVHDWSDGAAEPDRRRLHVLRVALEAARILEGAFGPTMVQAWFVGGDMYDLAPVEMLRNAVTEGDDPARAVIGAAQAFVNQF